MDGQYLSRKDEMLVVLQDWIDRVIAGKLWDKHVDLHIDQVDELFGPVENWITGSLFLFDCIESLLDNAKYDILLAIPLSCTSQSGLATFTKLESVVGELEFTPPSFYLYPKGEKNYVQTLESAMHLESVGSEVALEVYYKEEQEEDESEYYRTLFLKRSIISGLCTKG